MTSFHEMKPLFVILRDLLMIRVISFYNIRDVFNKVSSVSRISYHNNFNYEYLKSTRNLVREICRSVKQKIISTFKHVINDKMSQHRHDS